MDNLAASTLISTTTTGNHVDATMVSVSPLELFHPDGIARHALVLGSGCPELLLPGARAASDKAADLVVVAPTVVECHSDGWFDRAVSLVAQRLAVDGVVYVLVPPRWRLRVMRLLKIYKLHISLLIAHLPNSTTSRYLVPLDALPAQYTFAKLMPVRPWKRHLTALALRFPGGSRTLGCGLPSVGLVVRRSGARPLYDWLFQYGDEVPSRGSAVIHISRRRETTMAVLHRFSSYDALPSAVVKLPLSPASATACVDEAAAMNQLRSAAQNAGARVPEAAVVDHAAGYQVLVQTTLRGQSAAVLLASKPDQLLELVERVTNWLEQWSRSTMVVRTLDHNWLGHEILAPAALLAPLIPYSIAYQDWLKARCAGVVGAPMPFVAAHNDLTMWNILLDERGRLGIVDWEASRAEFFPLTDFFYMVTDAVASARGYANRLAAFEACFGVGGTYAATVARLRDRLGWAVSIAPDMVDLCFHACWLHHARNEYQSSEANDQRPFLQIVQRLALNHSHHIAGDR